MNGETLVVRKLKFDGSVRYSWPGASLPDPPRGWLIVHHHPALHVKGGTVSPPADEAPAHMLHYIGLELPVTVLFAYSLAGEFLEAKCDAALPGTFNGGIVDFVDMDLDVVVLPGGQHYVRDQAIFAERSVTMGYTEEAKRTAHLGILHSLRMVRRRQFPFDGHADELIRELLSGTREPK